MIGQAHVRDIKIIDADAGTMQNKVNLPERGMAWVGRDVGKIGVFQSCRSQKQIQLSAAPEGIEIAGNNHFLVGIQSKGMELFELVLPVPVFEGQVDDENGNGLEISLDNQLFYALFEIVKMKIFNGLFGQQGIGLLLQNRDSQRQ